MKEYGLKEISDHSVDFYYYKSQYQDVNYLNWSPTYHYLKYGAELSRKRFNIGGFFDFERDFPVVISLASMPSRIRKLEKVISSVIHQVDLVYVYLNNYRETPSFLIHDKIVVFKSEDYGDLKDNGKFYSLKFVSDDSYFITLDDDIYYPEDYVNEIVRKIDYYDKKCVVGVHGAIYGKLARSFFDRKLSILKMNLSTICQLVFWGLVQ